MRSGWTLLLPLLLGAPAIAQESRPATRPAAFASNESLRLLAGCVMRPRLIALTTELCALGPRVAGSDALAAAARWIRAPLDTFRIDAIGDAPPLVLSCSLATPAGSPGAHASGAGASALLEAARVLDAASRGKQIAALPFRIRFDTGAEAAESRPGAPIAEIRFGALAIGTARDCLFVTVSGSGAAKDAMVARVCSILLAWRGERGFWSEYEILADASEARPDGATRVTLSCTAPAGAARLGNGGGVVPPSAGDTFAAAGTATDVPSKTIAVEPQNAVNAARFALILIATLADEGASR